MKNRLFLHVCCAPDAVVPFRDLKAEAREWEIFGYFYGSNIHPKDEYQRRADAVRFLSEREGIPVLFRRYDPGEWLAVASPLADEPEGGMRCRVCFALQLQAAAKEAPRHGAMRLCTTLTTSPLKNVPLINGLGEEIALSGGLSWENRVWRKKDGYLRSVRISGELGLYRQNYCGCQFSRR